MNRTTTTNSSVRSITVSANPILLFPHRQLRGLLLGLVLLAPGIMVYVFFRRDPILVQTWLGIPNVFQESIASDLPDWMLFNLPDGLWAFSVAIFLAWHFSGSIKRIVFCGIVSMFFGSILEALQILEFLPGTGDYWDIFAMTIGAFAACLLLFLRIHIQHFNRYNYEE